MYKNYILSLVVFFFCQTICSQTLEKNEETFIFFTKKISEIEELQEVFFKVLTDKEDTALFINPLSEYFPKDTIVSTKHNDKKLHFYLKKYLFFYGIYYWLEFSTFEVLEQKAIFEFFMNDAFSKNLNGRKYTVLFELEGEDWNLKKLEILY